MRTFKNLLVTGGCGFIGTNFIRFLLEESDFRGRIINLDKLTYSGNPDSLSDLEKKVGNNRYVFEKADICDNAAVERIFSKYAVDGIVHFAAESHVDRSILGPAEFIQTNIVGTFILLENARKIFRNPSDFLFHHVSTDEVYGSLGSEGYFEETTHYDPRSPYSAAKASSDHLVRSYFHTYGLPVTISNCSNNYGPYQFPEKVVPVMILNMLEGKALPIYGDGKNIRDWLYVRDHCTAIWKIITNGDPGETFNIGGDNEQENIAMVRKLCRIVANKTGKASDTLEKLMTFVKDRPGHDRRYAIDCSKMKRVLGWKPEIVDFDMGLDLTVDWYLSHQDWINRIKSGEYRAWIEKNSALRAQTFPNALLINNCNKFRSSTGHKSL